MIKDVIDTKIADAMKNREMAKLETLRMIKSTLVKAEKDGTELTEASEAKIMQKMVKQTEDAIKQFKSANRMDLVDKELVDLSVIKEFAPKEVSDDEIMAATIMACNTLQDEKGVEINMSVMKTVMNMVQSIYPTASGKVISQVVRNWGK